MQRNWVSKLAAAVRDLRGILAVAWRMDAQLTFLYYLLAVVAALAPVATGLTFATLIDHMLPTATARPILPVIVAIAVAMHIAIIAVQAAIRSGLHERYHDYIFRYRLQDTFAYQFREKLAQLDMSHRDNPEVRLLITSVRAHHGRVPEVFRLLAHACIAGIAALSAAIALAPYGPWVVAAVLAGALPRLVARLKYGEMPWSIYGAGTPEARRRGYLGELLAEANATREVERFRRAPSPLARYRAIQARILALRRPLDRYRHVGRIAPLAEAALGFGLAWAALPQVTSGALSVGSFAFFIAMLQQLTASAADAGSSWGMVSRTLRHVRQWNELMALRPAAPHAGRRAREPA